MKLQGDSEREKLRHYLLGRQLDSDVSGLEERLMTESSLYEELVILEDELIDQYIRDQLSADERTRFESHFLQSPERRQKLRFAKAFNKYVDMAHAPNAEHELGLKEAPHRPDDVNLSLEPKFEQRSAVRKRFFGNLWPIRNPALNYGLVAALAVVVTVGAWFVWTSSRHPAPYQPSAVLSIALTPGLSRDPGQSIKEVALPADVGTLRLQLLLIESQYSSYEAVLLNHNGQTVTAKSNLTAEPVTGGRAVLFDIPANLLLPDDYRVKLSGIAANSNRELVDSYSFKVLSR